MRRISFFILASILLPIFLVMIPSRSHAADCIVKSASFSPYGKNGESGSWKEGHNYFLLDNTGKHIKRNVSVTVNTQNCIGKRIEVWISGYPSTGAVSSIPGVGVILDWGSNLASNFATLESSIVLPDEHDNTFIVDKDTFVVHYKADEDNCRVIHTPTQWDCNYHLFISDVTVASDEKKLFSSSGTDNEDPSKLEFSCIADTYLSHLGNALSYASNIPVIGTVTGSITAPAGAVIGDRCDSNDNIYLGALGGLSSGGAGVTGWEFTKVDGAHHIGGNAVTAQSVEVFDTTDPCYTTDRDSEHKNDAGHIAVPGYKDNCYSFLAPLPGLKSVDTSTGLGNYLNIIFQVIVGLITVAAVVMIVLAGVQYMTTEAFTGKSEAKQNIINALLGLIFALAIYAILYTLNPQLLRLDFGSLRSQSADLTYSLDNIQTLSSNEYKEITGKLPPTTTEVDAAAHKAAAKLGIPYCVYPAIFSTESGGKYGPNTIGHDENVKSTNRNIPSRNKFLSSGKKYKGGTFTPPSDDPGCSLSKNTGICNDDNKILVNEPGLGLDWRFSHGMGATQITFFSDGNGNFTSFYSDALGKSVTPKDAMDLETDLILGGERYKNYLTNKYPDPKKQCNNDTRAAFDAYGDGSCDKRPDNGAGYLAAKKEATYRTCIQQFGSGS